MSDRTCSVDGCGRKYSGRRYCNMHYQRMLHTGTTDAPPERYPSWEVRLWAKVDQSGGPDACWPWVGSSHLPSGYGVISRDGRQTYSHRLAYESATGESLGKLQIDHMCFNHACCNPKHLRAVTVRQNAQNRQGAPRQSISGIRGVSQDKRDGTWYARVQHNGKQIRIGTFATPEEAGEAARLKRLELFTHNNIDRGEQPCA